MNYIKYAFITGLLAIGITGVSYIISNERDKSKLQLQNKSLDIQKQAFEQDLSQQQHIIIKTEEHKQKHKQKRQQIANKVHSIKSYSINNKTIIELQKIKNCELQNINNLEVLCQ